MLGLGGSVGTLPEGLIAQVLVVDSWVELEEKNASVKDKIVVLNAAWNISYGNSVSYRTMSAIRTSKYGAIAVLVRSITPYSLQTPHTGIVNYQENIKKIPAAAITVEDSAYLRRIQDRNQTIIVKLFMQASSSSSSKEKSYNLLGEITGTKYPNEYVLIGGHSDSWDVGQGAQDDAGGILAAWEALRIIKECNLVIQRTIRVVMWVDEETGGSGANQYVIDHKSEINSTFMALESDTGTFIPTSLLFTGTDSGLEAAYKIGNEYLKLLNVTIGSSKFADADISPLARLGVPAFSLRNSGVLPPDEYFNYHHTWADTFDKISKENFNLNVATIATTAWIVSQNEFPLRNL